MLSPPAKLRLLQRTSWSGYVYTAFPMVGTCPPARFFPSQPPIWDAEQITRIYHDDTAGIRIGMSHLPADREALKVGYACHG
jgi:hypothetical protein